MFPIWLHDERVGFMCGYGREEVMVIRIGFKGMCDVVGLM